jgi:hypothetical protein
LAALDPSAEIAAQRLHLQQVPVRVLVLAPALDVARQIHRMSRMQLLHSAVALEQVRRLLARPARVLVPLASLRDRLRNCWCLCWTEKPNHRNRERKRDLT